MPTFATRESDNRTTYGAMFNINNIKQANREAGFYFFSPDSMRFFDSRVLPTVYGGRFFITSERSGFDDPTRTYTVREFMPDGSIETVGEFNGHATIPLAKNAVRQAVKDRHDYYFEGRHGKNGRSATYVVNADDPWAAMERLHTNFRVFHMGRAMDHMSDYPRLTA